MGIETISGRFNPNQSLDFWHVAHLCLTDYFFSLLGAKWAALRQGEKQGVGSAICKKELHVNVNWPICCLMADLGLNIVLRVF